jgi:hypothetical protein
MIHGDVEGKTRFGRLGSGTSRIRMYPGSELGPPGATVNGFDLASWMEEENIDTNPTVS